MSFLTSSPKKTALFEETFLKRFTFPTYNSIHEPVEVCNGKICNA